MSAQKKEHHQQITTLKQEQQCNLQKYKINHGIENDSQRYQFEEKVTNLEMVLKMKEEKMEEVTKQLGAFERQLKYEREQN